MTVPTPSVETRINPESPTSETGQDQELKQDLDLKTVAKRIMAGAGVTAALAGAPAAAGPFQVTAVIADAACPVLIGGPSAEFKLAHKATFGYHSGVEQQIVNMGYAAWLDDQIDYTNIAGYAAYKLAVEAAYPAITYLKATVELCCGNFQMREMRRQELQKARLDRAVKSPAQLYERVVEFWTDHLNTFVLTPNLNRMKILEDREVIRAHALGKLKDIIYESAISPAMLLYLDGNTNKVGNPNENYAREFLELSTLGVDTCYNEATIQELAKAFTGWKVDTSVDVTPTCTGGPYSCGDVTFINGNHDNTAKTVVFPGCNTFAIPLNSGMGEVQLVVDMVTNPNLLDAFGAPNMLAEKTVKHIATKLATYFFNCNPPKRIINNMWAAYKTAYNAGNDDIAAMVKELLRKGNIHCSGPILKRPLHLAASAIRATGSILNDPGDEDMPDTLIGGFLNSAGHIPYFWPAPNGYHPGCDQDYWGANQLVRENLGASMFSIASPYFIVGVDTLPASQAVLNAASNQEVIDLIDSVMFGGFMPAFDKNRILQYMDSTIDILARVEAMGLTIGSPGFQWY